MTDKYQALRGTLDRINGEDTDDCFEAYIFWKRTFDVDDCKALLAERDALRGLLESAAGVLETVADAIKADEAPLERHEAYSMAEHTSRTLAT